jgi:hypothetical protein
MRFVVGFLSGVLGMLAGWAGLAALVIALAGSGHDDGGTAMGAFFNIGPVGGLIGFVAGVLLFVKVGTVTQASPAQATSAEVTPAEVTSSPDAQQSDVAPAPGSVAAPARKRISRPFAVAVVAIVAGLAWWGWYELIRSPYLSHGYMTLNLQFKLPSGMDLPAEASDVHGLVDEGGQHSEVLLGRAWHGTVGDRRVILATSSLSLKTWHRAVHLELPGVPEQTWQIDLPNDPDPTPGYSPWRLAGGNNAAKIEMNFSLTADH